MAVVAIGPLVWAGCKGAARPKRTALWTALGVLPFWFIEQMWLINVTEVGYPCLAVYLCVYSYAFVWAIGTARGADWPIPMSVVVPVAWTALEVVRGEIVFTGYAFFLLGQPLVDNPVLASPGAVFGAYGVSFLVAAIAGAVADAAGWSGLPRHSGGVGALATALVWGVLAWLGEWSGWPGPTQEIRVAVVQTHLPQDNKIAWPMGKRLKDFKRFGDLTRLGASQSPKPSLIVWPETMFPGNALNGEAVRVEREAGLRFRIQDDPDFPEGATVLATVFVDDLCKLQTEVGVPMLVGAIAAEGLRITSRPNGGVSRESDRRYNSVFAVVDGKVLPARYDKVDLTPFGEVIPYLWRWPVLQKQALSLGAGGMMFDLAFGEHIGPLDVPLGRSGEPDHPASLRVATPICFEATRAGLCRRLVRPSDGPTAGLIVNLSNDGWFGPYDGGRRVHLLAARWRCIELGIPMVRAVNTGVSAAIDRRGRVLNQRLTDPLRSITVEDGVLDAHVQVANSPGRTIFAVVGLVPAYLVSVAGFVGIGLMWRRRRMLERRGV